MAAGLWTWTVCHNPIAAVADRKIVDWGSCAGHQARGHQRGEGKSKNNANLHNEKHMGHSLEILPGAPETIDPPLNCSSTHQ